MKSSAARVARIITRLNIGGPAIQAIDLTRELRSAGFETCLIHGKLAAGEGDMSTLLPVVGAEVVYVDDLVRPISPWKDLRAFWRIYRSLCRWQPEIVHTHMAKAGAVGRLAALFYNRTRSPGTRSRLVHTYHGHVFEGYFGSPSTRMFLAVERWLARRTDAIIAISPQVMTDLTETYGVARETHVRLIPLGFNLDRLLSITAADRVRAKAALQIPDGAITVTTVGRLTAIKQHSLFLEMARLLGERSSRFVFLIAGDGELRAGLEAQAAAGGIGVRTRFLSWRGDLETVYGATDIFVLTSRNEGTPVALIEAMASGVASVSTDVGGVRDVITGTTLGTLVPFGDASALAHAVATLADDEPLRAAVGAAARASVQERYHFKRLFSDITSLYWHLLENRGTLL
ncbi:MAG TPA: glycosyltransferase [Vicinamibacterales bacterium]|nr:glycosyltransferase [Vicinamibacterales bacterium]